MEETHTTTQQEQTAPPRGEELVRPLGGRIIAGVATGVAQRLGMPTWVVRLAFVITAFFGGLGIALYLAGWALIRSENEADTPAERFFAGSTSPMSWLGVVVIVVGALIILGNLSFFSAEFLVAVGLITVGVLMYTGYIAGPKPEGTDVDDKEGVQPMTSSDTLTEEPETLVDDSPVDADTPPPPPPVPTPQADPKPPAPPRETSILGRLTIGIALLGMGVLAIVDQIDSVPIDADPRHYLALAVTIVGVGLLVGAFAGRARWLIILSAILVPTLLFSPVFEYDWTSDEFDVFERPTTFTEVEGFYSIDAGNLVIDLTELPWDGQEVTLGAHVDLGNLEVRVPWEVGIEGEASVDIGRASGPNGESFGIGDPTVGLGWHGDLGTVYLDLSVDVGNVEVDQR